MNNYYDPHDSQHPFSIAVVDYEKQAKIDAEVEAKAKPSHRNKKTPSLETVLPIEAFNKKHTVEQALSELNFKKFGDKWLYPDSESGIPGISLLDGLYFSHHSSDPLCDGHTHDAFDLYATHKHNGDFKAALKVVSDTLQVESGLTITEHNKKVNSEKQSTNKLIDFSPVTIDNDFLDKAKTLIQRPWIILNSLLRGYITAVFSPGGVGKSVFSITEAISVAVGRDLLGLGVKEQTNVLLINNEDDQDELERRIAGISLKYDVNPSDLKNKFFYFSGYGSPLIVAERSNSGSEIVSPNTEILVKYINQNQIGLVIFDPFISTHDIPENDNTDIDKVITKFKAIAKETNVAILLIHHTRKSQGNDSEIQAGDAEAGRGASSLKDASRIIETLARMSLKTGKKLDLSSDEVYRHIRLDSGKLNFGIASYDAKWFRMETVTIPNGDTVGVPVPVNLKPLFKAADNSNGEKWDAESVAQSLERIMNRNASVKWADIRQKFMDDNDIKKSHADGVRAKISDDKSKPTRINVGGKNIDYWTEKKHQTAPVYIHRNEETE